jgi:SNF2 family DNA or RNA helicase
MTESVEDLYSQLRVIHELVGVNRYAFRNRYAIKGGFKGKEIIGCKDPEALANLIEPFIFHAKKSEWAKTLPEKTFTTMPVEMNPEQKRVYKEIKEEFLSEIEPGVIVTATAVIAVYQKLTQISTGFILDGDKDLQIIGKRNAKLEALIDLIAGLGATGKAVVVCLHRGAIDLASAALDAGGYRWVSVRGGDDIDAAKDAFNSDSGIDVCLRGVQAGSVGLTLLGCPERPCSTMIFLQNSWSAYLRTQTVDRIHRYGQHYPCHYIDLVASPIDRKIISALSGKQSLVDSIMGALSDEC